MRMFKVVVVAAFLSAAWIAAAGAAEDKKADDTYTKEEIMAKMNIK